MTFDDIKEMQIGSKKVKEAWLNGRQVYPSEKRIMDSLVCWYDIGKQQCTNESMAANPVLADLSGNGHDIECYNFAWAGMSGIGGYVFQPLDKWYKAPSNNGTYTVEGYTLHITKLNTTGNVYYINNTAGKNYVESIEGNTVTTKSFRIRINGLPDGKKVAIGGLLPLSAGSEHVNVLFPKQHFNSNGEHIVDSVQATVDSENDIWGGNVNYPDISINSDTADDVDITIEILPEYPNALVSDGVDDYCYTDGLPILTDYTVIAKRKILANTPVDNNSCVAYKGKNGFSVNNSFIFERLGRQGDYMEYNFGAYNYIKLYPDEISYCTKNSYNGDSINIGTNVDNDDLVLYSISTGSSRLTCALYSFLLFDRTLTTAEIEWVKKNMIESGGVLATNWADSSLYISYIGSNMTSYRANGELKSTRITIKDALDSAFIEILNVEDFVPSYKIKVSGLRNGIKLRYKTNTGSGDYSLLNMEKDGIYTLPKVIGNNNRYVGFKFNKIFENENIVIQQLLSE